MDKRFDRASSREIARGFILVRQQGRPGTFRKKP